MKPCAYFILNCTWYKFVNFLFVFCNFFQNSQLLVNSPFPCLIVMATLYILNHYWHFRGRSSYSLFTGTVAWGAGTPDISSLQWCTWIWGYRQRPFQAHSISLVVSSPSKFLASRIVGGTSEGIKILRITLKLVKTATQLLLQNNISESL